MDKKITDVQVEQLRNGLQKIKFERVFEEGRRSLEDAIEEFQARINSAHNTYKMMRGY